MSLGSVVAIRAIPFLELLDAEENRLAEQVSEAGAGVPEAAAMDNCRQRLAQGVNAFVRSLPVVVRNDVNTSRAAAYALVGLADERILHHPAGGLDRWREQLLEYELYGSALAGQEIVNRAREASYATAADAEGANGSAMLAQLYLAVFRAGFEGALRGDDTALSTLTTTLMESVGAGRNGHTGLAAGGRPSRIGLPVRSLAVAGGRGLARRRLPHLVSGFRRTARAGGPHRRTRRREPAGGHRAGTPRPQRGTIRASTS